MRPVGSYCTDISRCTVNKALNLAIRLLILKSSAVHIPCISPRFTVLLGLHVVYRAFFNLSALFCYVSSFLNPANNFFILLSPPPQL